MNLKDGLKLWLEEKSGEATPFERYAMKSLSEAMEVIEFYGNKKAWNQTYIGAREGWYFEDFDYEKDKILFDMPFDKAREWLERWK